MLPTNAGTQPTQRILLVEDNAEDRRRVREHLAAETRRTYLVWEVEGGAAALAHCRAHVPDCVLLDHTLPDMPYLDVLHGMASTWREPHALPVILLAYEDAEATAAEAVSEHIWDYIIKGAATPYATCRSVHLALERAALLRELYRHRAAARAAALPGASGARDTSAAASPSFGSETQEDSAEDVARMDDFLALASHELRTPLTAIKGNIQLAIRRLAIRPQEPRAAFTAIVKALELLRRTEAQTDRLERLVGSLLDTLSVRHGQLGLRTREYDVAGLARTVVAQARRLAPDRQIRLNAPEGRLAIVCDGERTQQALETYLDNALKYSDVASPVDVEVAADADTGVVRFAVRDHGPGVPPERRAHIWERYQRVPGIEAQSGSAVGLGLGLYIVRSVVERQGGSVGVESGYGDGALFWFTLPLRPASASDAAPGKPESGSQLRG